MNKPLKEIGYLLRKVHVPSYDLGRVLDCIGINNQKEMDQSPERTGGINVTLYSHLKSYIRLPPQYTQYPNETAWITKFQIDIVAGAMDKELYSKTMTRLLDILRINYTLRETRNTDSDILNKDLTDLVLLPQSRSPWDYLRSCTVGGLLQLSQQDFLAFKNIGPKRLNDLRVNLSKYGLDLRS